ncbi:MAG: hypothetical protein A2Y15_05390 [Clostridiales bacterium GWF2_36_10]|nr:MAG: hypothetical protein A2Y15_05390 [Clostridiales bacterium GWF2_36_10]HAN20098.1 hypothetical protein [Clostridiales bacterium]
MTMCSDIKNMCFIEELKNKTGQDIALFCIDGLSYYGKLNQIDKCNIATLNSFDYKSLNNISPQTAFIDTDKIVCFGFYSKNYMQTLDLCKYEYKEAAVCNNDALIEKLKSMERISISTIGGFIFSGELIDLQKKTAKLKAESVYGLSEGNKLNLQNIILVNLKAATAIIS